MTEPRDNESKIIELNPWAVYKFPWGFGIRHRNGPWETVILRGTGQEIDVSRIPVELHLNGIEFLEIWKRI